MEDNEYQWMDETNQVDPNDDWPEFGCLIFVVLVLVAGIVLYAIGVMAHG